MNTAQLAGYDHCSMTVSDVKIINSQRVKKAQFQGESYWNQQPQDGLIVLLAGDLTVHYVDRQHQLAPGELFQLHRLSYYRLTSAAGAEIIALEGP
jgi:hypothetical protein